MIPFVKMQGIGNDFVVLDVIASTELPLDLAAFAKWACHRRFGIGADGVLTLEKGESQPFRMRMWNPDGTSSEMCGNGVRCVARLIFDRAYSTEPAVTIETGAGLLELQSQPDGQIRVNMGLPRLRRGEIGMLGPENQGFVDQAIPGGRYGTAVSMGNPHLVIFVEDVMKVDLAREGSELERLPIFPQRTNVHFIQVKDKGHLLQRTWERGAGATLACGTGACASAVAAVITGRADRKVRMTLPGGDLIVELSDGGSVWMTGPAKVVYEGQFQPDSWSAPFP